MMKLYFFLVIIGVCWKCRSDMVYVILDKDNFIESLYVFVNIYFEDIIIIIVLEEVGIFL